MNRVLIVEDERPLLHALSANLRARGYQVELTEDGEGALAAAARSVHDAAIVDLGLPGLSGIEVIKGLRGWTSIPVIVLSARHQETDKIAALDAGADDYITKPFGMGEFLARLRAALRRSAPGAHVEPMVSTAHFRIDLASRTVSDSQGRPIHLTPTQWLLVEILVRNPGRLVSQRQLLEQVWGPTLVEQANYLRVFMAQIRRKLEPNPSLPVYFVTEPGMGVRFVPAPQPEAS